MSATEKHAFDQAFPVIQEDDLFGGFSSLSQNMDSEDPFASNTKVDDPFSAFEVTVPLKATINPFLIETYGDTPEPSSSPVTRTTTPMDEVQSLQSDEVPWPGNNTAETVAETSRDSAAVSSFADVAMTHDHAVSSMDTSESSASSGRAVPNIALDSDSGNLTADANENACLPNTIYALMDSGEGESTVPPFVTQIPPPQIVLTEATVISEKSSRSEAPDMSTSTGDGNSRLLDSSEMDTSQDRSHSNRASVSSANCSAVQVDNLSTMNISLINTASEGSDSIAGSQNTEGLQTHDFFVRSESCQGEEVEDSETKSGLADEATLEKTDTHSLPKTNRVFTSSPINPRRTSSGKCDENHLTTSWEQSYRERISSKDEKEKKDIEALKKQAKSDLEHWYRDRQTKIEAQHALHLEHQDVQYSERSENAEKTIWQRMANLALDLHQAQKVDEKRKDTSKMKHLLQLLATKAPSLKR